MNYSRDVETFIKASKNVALDANSNSIRPEHLFLAMLEKDSVAYNYLKDENLNIDAIKQTLTEWSAEIQYQIDREFKDLTDRKLNVSLDPETSSILKSSELVAKRMESDYVEVAHVFLAILENKNNLVTELFSKSKNLLKNLKSRLKNEDDEDLINDEDMAEELSKKSKSLLAEFGTDLTKAALDGELDPVVGRKAEIEQISIILSRRKKNNPCLVGEPGVGKSAIAEGIAQLIVKGDVPKNLKNKRIIMLDMGSLVAGTKYRGEFEQRIRSIIKEMETNKDIILFIDEVHTIIGAGGAQGSLDASNMLKPALARGNFHCIGATTQEEYRKYIEKDKALERRFQKVTIEATSKSETIEILHNVKSRYEDHHNVTYTDDAIEACVSLTEKYITDKCLPDKAIDMLDLAGSMINVKKEIITPKSIIDLENKIKKSILEKEKFIETQHFEKAAIKRDNEKILKAQLEVEKLEWEKELSRNTNRDEVNKDHVAEIVAKTARIPIDNVSADENAKLKDMAIKVKSVVIGQDDAVDKLVIAIKRARIGIKDPSKPIGSYIFLGPTGVGKTYLAKVLAKELFGSADAMTRIDMSEYMEKFAVSRLVGAPPGYVGHEDAGELTEAVRKRPYSIILLDEIEKAHPDIQNILLQVLDDGILTDSNGRKVDFKNTIIIMTSNIGSRKVKEFGTGIGFETETRAANIQKEQNAVIDKELKKLFSPEFLNRIDDVLMFNSLTKENVSSIVDVELKITLDRLNEIGYFVKIDPSVKEYIFEKGYDKDLGARPLKRAIQKYIENKITDSIINNEINVGDNITLKYDKDSDDIKILKTKSKNKKLEIKYLSE